MVAFDVMRTPNLREVELRRRLGYTHVLTRKSGSALAWAHSESWAFDLVNRLEKAGSVRSDDILIVPLQEFACSQSERAAIHPKAAGEAADDVPDAAGFHGQSPDVSLEEDDSSEHHDSDGECGIPATLSFEGSKLGQRGILSRFTAWGASIAGVFAL